MAYGPMANNWNWLVVSTDRTDVRILKHDSEEWCNQDLACLLMLSPNQEIELKIDNTQRKYKMVELKMGDLEPKLKSLRSALAITENKPQRTLLKEPEKTSETDLISTQATTKHKSKVNLKRIDCCVKHKDESLRMLRDEKLMEEAAALLEKSLSEANSKLGERNRALAVRVRKAAQAHDNDTPVTANTADDNLNDGIYSGDMIGDICRKIEKFPNPDPVNGLDGLTLDNRYLGFDYGHLGRVLRVAIFGKEGLVEDMILPTRTIDRKPAPSHLVIKFFTQVQREFPRSSHATAMDEARIAANKAGLSAREKKYKTGKYSPAKIAEARRKKKRVSEHYPVPVESSSSTNANSRDTSNNTAQINEPLQEF